MPRTTNWIQWITVIFLIGNLLNSAYNNYTDKRYLTRIEADKLVEERKVQLKAMKDEMDINSKENRGGHDAILLSLNDLTRKLDLVTERQAVMADQLKLQQKAHN